MNTSASDPRLTTPSGLQLARLRTRQRRLDAGFALFAVFWLVFSSLAEFFSDFRVVSAFAGVFALGVAWWALRRGDGRVADKALAAIFGTDSD